MTSEDDMVDVQPIIEWSYEHSGRADGRSIVPAPGGGVYLAGDEGERAWVAAIADGGKLLWEHSYCEDEERNCAADDITVGEDGMVYVVGRVGHDSQANTDLWLAKFTPEGEALWTRRYDYGGVERGRAILVVGQRIYAGGIRYASGGHLGEARGLLATFDLDGNPIADAEIGDGNNNTVYISGLRSVTPEQIEFYGEIAHVRQVGVGRVDPNLSGSFEMVYEMTENDLHIMSVARTDAGQLLVSGESTGEARRGMVALLDGEGALEFKANEELGEGIWVLDASMDEAGKVHATGWVEESMWIARISADTGRVEKRALLAEDDVRHIGHRVVQSKDGALFFTGSKNYRAWVMRYTWP